MLSHTNIINYVTALWTVLRNVIALKKHYHQCLCWVILHLIQLTAQPCKVILAQLKGVAMLLEWMLGATDNTFKLLFSKTLGHKIWFILNLLRSYLVKHGLVLLQWSRNIMATRMSNHQKEGNKLKLSISQLSQFRNNPEGFLGSWAI